MLRRSVVLVGVVYSVSVSCGASPLGHVSSPSRTAATTPASSVRDSQMPCQVLNPVPTFAPSAASQRSLELVRLKGGNSSYVVRDITDLGHPFTVQTFGPGSDVYEGGGLPTFVNASELSYFSHGSAMNLQDFAYVRTPLSGSPKTVVARPCLQGANVGGSWNQDGTAFTYGSASGTYAYLHIVAAGRDRVVDSFTWDGGGGVYGPPSGPRFSTDGSYISWVGFGSFPSRVWASDGKVLMASNTSLANPAVWSGDSLYFQDTNGIEKWHTGVVSSFLPNVHWLAPHSSPVGGQIAYTALDADGTGHVMIVDIATRALREVSRSRAFPVFLKASLLWYVEVRPCAPTDPAGRCGGTIKTTATGNTFVFDLQTGTESSSILQAVYDVWPHGDRTDTEPAY